MRQRTANEKAINKTLFFLQALQKKCDGSNFQDFTTSQLHQQFSVSKSTFSTCLKLGIVKKSVDGLEWLKENPNREMALQILAVLLENAKKQIVTPISADWIALNETLRDISEKISMSLNRNNQALAGVKTPPKEARLFDAQEKREEQRFELLKAIATGLYGDSNIRMKYDEINNLVIKATNDLIIKYYAK